MIGLVLQGEGAATGNGMLRGGSRGQVAPSREEGAIKIPHRENQTESAKRQASI